MENKTCIILILLLATNLFGVGEVYHGNDVHLTGDEKSIFWYNGAYTWGMKASGSLAGSYTIIWPPTIGTTGQQLTGTVSGSTLTLSMEDPGGIGGVGDIDAVWSITTGNVNALTAASGDTLDATNADSTIPWEVDTTAAPTTEGMTIWDSDNDILTIGDGSGTDYVAYGASDGDALAGDSATSFFNAGTIEHEYGGLEANVSAYTGLLAISGSSTAEIDALSELEGQIADVTAFVVEGTACSDIEGTGLSIGAGTLNWSAASTDLTDTADLLYEAELDTFSELQAQIADKTLVNQEDAISSIDIDGGTINGITDLAVVDGGTGASDLNAFILADGSNALAGAWDMNNENLTNVDIDSGAIDDTTIGGTTPGAGTFNALKQISATTATLFVETTGDVGGAEIDLRENTDGDGGKWNIKVTQDETLKIRDVEVGADRFKIDASGDFDFMGGDLDRGAGDIIGTGKIIFSGTPDTQIFYMPPGADKIILRTAGTNRLEVSSDGVTSDGLITAGAGLNTGGNVDITGTIRTTADQDWNLGAASAQADFAGDTKIRVTIGGTDYDIVALAVP